MKLAILGSSPIALEAALRFHFHGASLTLFCGDEQPVRWESGSGMGTNESGIVIKGDATTYSHWVETYQKPLVNFLREHQVVKAYEVVSVTKRFLSVNEEIPGKSRFHDLFRVIYEVNPQEFIKDQKESNPEIYQKLSEEFMGSLQSVIEMYEDFDAVIDARYPMVTSSMAASGRALGEKRINPSKVIYGLETLISSPLESDRDLAVVGSGNLAAEVLVKLSGWMKDPRHNLFLISTDADPFSGNTRVAEVLSMMEKDFLAEIEVFEKKLAAWQELDDFVQVKIPRPAEPIPRLNFFSGHNVTAVDELIDRKRLFLTLESPEFREGKKHSANNLLDLKTIGVDRIFVALDPERKNITPNLRHPERGYFDLLPEHWNEDLKKLQGIEHEIFKLFSPVDTH